jgi:hypothetical protein
VTQYAIQAGGAANGQRLRTGTCSADDTGLFTGPIDAGEVDE